VGDGRTRIERAGSWRELDDAITDTAWTHSGLDQVRAGLVFRGLARSSFSNVSGLTRLVGERASLERHLLRNFRKYAHREAPGPTVWDWLALAQHHGLPTRLLDWTFSPLVALHFATASWPSEEGVLWAVDCEGAHRSLPPLLGDALDEEGALVFTTGLLAEHAPEVEDLDRLQQDEDPFVLFFEPPSLDERIVNQAAVLSAMSNATARMDAWLDARPELWRAWRIDPQLKREIRNRLDQANLNERVLLPGLDGLAAWLRRYYSPVRDEADEEGAFMDDSARHAQFEGSMAGPPPATEGSNG